MIFLQKIERPHSPIVSNFILNFSLCYLFLLYSLIIFNNQLNFIWLDYYTYGFLTISLITSIVLLIRSCFKNGESKSNQSKPVQHFKYLLILFFAFAGVALLRWHHLFEMTLWLDEIFQSTVSLNNSPAQSGISQHQPPLDMLLSHFGRKFWGTTILGVRFHAWIASSLLCIAFFECCWHFFESLSSGIIGFILLSFHWIIFKYGYEARPISIGILFFVIGLTFTINYLQNNSRITLFKIWIALCLSGLFLGMQPILVIFCGAVVWFLLAILRKQNEARLLCFVWISAFCYLIPTILSLVFLSPPKITAGAQTISFFGKLISLSLSDFSIIKGVVGNLYPLYLAFLMHGLILIFSKRFRLAPKIQSNLVFFLVSISLSYSIGIVVFFKTFVNHDMRDYYHIITLPLFILLLISFVRLLQFSRILSFMAITGTAALIFYFYPFGGIEKVKRDLGRENLRELYSLIADRASKNSYLVSLCAINDFNYCPERTIGAEFYLPPEKNYVAYDSSSDPLVLLNEKINPPELVFIFHKVWSEWETFRTLGVEDLGTDTFAFMNDFDIVVFREESHYLRALQFLERVLKKVESKNRNSYVLLQHVILLALKTQNYDLASHFLEKYSKVKGFDIDQSGFALFFRKSKEFLVKKRAFEGSDALDGIPEPTR